MGAAKSPSIVDGYDGVALSVVGITIAFLRWLDDAGGRSPSGADAVSAQQSKRHLRRKRMLEGATTGALPGDFMLMRQPHVFIAYVPEHCAYVGGGESTDSPDLRGLKL